MAVDIRIVVPNRPGTSLEVLDALAEADLVLHGFCGDIRPGERWGFLHVLVDDADAARRAIESTGFEITSEHDVEVFDVEPRAGSLADTVRAYVEAGRNIEVLYLGSNDKIVIGPEDLQRPRPGVSVKDAKY